MRHQTIETILEEKREVHPELRKALTWPGFQRICGRERIPVIFGPLPADAVLISGLGTAVIVINDQLPFRRHTYRGAHELAHWWLHGDDEPVVYQMSDSSKPDRREDEAEFLATLMLQGPPRRPAITALPAARPVIRTSGAPGPAGPLVDPYELGDWWTGQRVSDLFLKRRPPDVRVRFDDR